MYQSDMLLESKRVTYFFGQKPPKISPGERLTSVERALFASAAKHELRLCRVKGVARGQYLSEPVTVYRLSSGQHHAFADFIFEGGGCNLLLLAVAPEYQGNGFSLKDFVINKFVKVAFECGANRVFGVAGLTDNPLRGREWRNLPARDGQGTKLLRLYEVLGFATHPETSSFELKAPRF